MRQLLLSMVFVAALDSGLPAFDARPPQLVVVSFDGAGDAEQLREWRTVARATHAHFTFFLSGVYLVPWAERAGYRPPQRPPGSSDIGFAPDRAWVDDLATELRAAVGEGHEIATHYGGHFCGPRGVRSWGPRDWASELDAASAIATAHGLPAPLGGRTPCLEGDLALLRRVLAARGMRYDASATSDEGQWPEKRDGVWSFPLPLIPVAGAEWKVLAMDYNFYFNQSGAEDVGPVEASRFERQVRESYLAWFDRAYHGDRAPILIGHHFTDWSAGAYVRALSSFVRAVCVLPRVRCVTFRELADWLDEHPR